jgi:hypothetical protein
MNPEIAITQTCCTRPGPFGPAWAPLCQSLFVMIWELVDTDFSEVNELRDTVFDFRRSITRKDTDRHRRFFDRLRYDRELCTKAMSARQ